MPVGGLSQLQGCVAAGTADFFGDFDGNPSRQSFRDIISLIISAGYVCGAQGRIAAWADMRYDQILSLKSKGFAMSRVLKTGAKYGLQPVVLPLEAKKLFKTYVEVFRPFASEGKICQPKDPLWLNFAGNPIQKKDLSRLLTGYFQRQLGIQITPTGCRSQVETCSARQLERGKAASILFYPYNQRFSIYEFVVLTRCNHSAPSLCNIKLDGAFCPGDKRLLSSQRQDCRCI